MLKAKRIAVVGLSDDPMRASYGVADYLRAHGYEIVPVNPNHDEVLGLKCYARLADVPGAIDLVNVFRRPQFCAQVTREAIEVGAKGVWLQSGILNETARELASKAKIDFVQNRCIMVEHMHRER
jgi:predicted CoA-binding protein